MGKIKAKSKSINKNRSNPSEPTDSDEEDQKHTDYRGDSDSKTNEKKKAISAAEGVTQFDPTLNLASLFSVSGNQRPSKVNGGTVTPVLKSEQKRKRDDKLSNKDAAQLR